MRVRIVWPSSIIVYFRWHSVDLGICWNKTQLEKPLLVISFFIKRVFNKTILMRIGDIRQPETHLWGNWYRVNHNMSYCLQCVQWNHLYVPISVHIITVVATLPLVLLNYTHTCASTQTDRNCVPWVEKVNNFVIIITRTSLQKNIPNQL